MLCYLNFIIHLIYLINSAMNLYGVIVFYVIKSISLDILYWGSLAF